MADDLKPVYLIAGSDRPKVDRTVARLRARFDVDATELLDVADTTGRLIKLDPVDYADAYFYNSVANYYLKNFDAAEKSVREAQKLDTRNQMPKTNQLLGVILAEKQDFAGAAENIKKYLTFLPEGKEAETAKKQLIELEKMTATAAPQ